MTETFNVLCTMPGRYGDILWSLPTVRAIKRFHMPCKLVLVVSQKYSRGRFLELLQGQDYIDEVRAATPEVWPIQETAPITPLSPYMTSPVCRIDEARPDRTFHLGYQAWPTLPLAMQGLANATELEPRIAQHFSLNPWIVPIQETWKSTLPGVFVGFSDEHIELKMGVLAAVTERFPLHHFDVVYASGQRHREWQLLSRYNRISLTPASWVNAATFMTQSVCHLGCLSAPWVLANAVGIRAVVFEPNQQRWNPIFFHSGQPDGPDNRLVLGNDGLPTFDARHVGDALRDVLFGRSVRGENRENRNE